MTAMRLAAALALGSILGISCYSEPLPPSTYRYACDGDGDCNANESCRHGRCERPCTQLTAADDCPSAEGFVACFNGACATTCAVGSDYCTSGQTCIDLSLDLGGASSPFGGGGSSAAVGICGLECDAGDNDICPDGEICLAELGACVVDCSQGQACPDSYSCVFGVCAPLDSIPTVETSGDTTDAGSTSAMGSSSDSTGDSTGDATGDSAGSTTAMGAEPDDEERR